MRKKLESQADQIEATLAAHRIPARVTGGTVTPRWIRFRVLPALGVGLSQIKQLNDVLAAALGVSDCRIARRGAALDLEIPRGDPRAVRLLPLVQQLDQLAADDGSWSFPPVTATLGLAEDGAPLLIRLPSPDVGHILVAGATGAGKSTLLKSVVLSLALTNPPRTLALVLIDGSGGATFSPFEGLPHVARSTAHPGASPARLLQALTGLLAQRSPGARPHIVVVIDNLQHLLALDDNVHRPLTQLLHRGHPVGLHLVAASDAFAHDAFLVRIVGRVESGWPGTGAGQLQGQGDFIAIAEGQVTRFQAAHVTEDEIDSAVGQIRSGSTLLPDGALSDQPPAIQSAILPSPVGEGGHAHALS